MGTVALGVPFKSPGWRFRADDSSAEVTKQGLWVEPSPPPDSVGQVVLERSPALRVQTPVAAPALRGGGEP